ncbi:MAG: hypothetical protein MUO41_09770, partial [Methyloceanibacter sp.]|nr:hypothetical protein [Methyloceanibacter sp.]
GVIQDYSFNWSGVFQLWPLFLILIGLNIIVKHAPQPLGGLLSAFVGLVAIGIFGYVLLFGEDNATLNRFGIINNPAVILADEPTGNLDSVNAAAILDLLFEIKRARGASLVMVTHEQSQAKRCSRQIKIKDGIVYDQGSAAVLEPAL